MQKIKYELIKRIIKEPLTSLEFNFLLYLAKICDQKGEVSGIYYSSIKKELECSSAKFYQLRDSLTDKGFITWEKNHGADIDIKLIGNDFTVDGEVVYKDYLNINISILNDKSFLALRVGAKKMALELIKRAIAGQNNKIWYIPYNQYKKYATMINVSIRMITSYFNDLKKWIHIGHNIQSKNKLYDVVTILAGAVKTPQCIGTKRGQCKSIEIYPEQYQHQHMVETFCRRNKIKTNKLNLRDTAGLMQQYYKAAKELGKSIFNMLVKAISNTSSGELNSISVHKALINIIKFN